MTPRQDHLDCTVLACVEHFRRIPGVRRAALASVFPRQVEYEGQDRLGLLVDVGATVRCEPQDLVHFAVMGSAYAERVSKVASPRVGLLNMGSEENKGGALLVDVYQRLAALEGINFVGNVEGHELPTGRADVVVCEGLLGNVALKLWEGLGDVIDDIATRAAERNWRWRFGVAMLSGGVGRLREMTDYASYGGAPILGFEHLAIKAHGRSDPKAIANAIKVAAKASRDGLIEAIREVI